MTEYGYFNKRTEAEGWRSDPSSGQDPLERVAEALWDADDHRYPVSGRLIPWKHAGDWWHDHFRRLAHVALAASRGAAGDPHRPEAETAYWGGSCKTAIKLIEEVVGAYEEPQSDLAMEHAIGELKGFLARMTREGLAASRHQLTPGLWSATIRTHERWADKDAIEAIIHDWLCGCGRGQACDKRADCKEAADQIVGLAARVGESG